MAFAAFMLVALGIAGTIYSDQVNNAGLDEAVAQAETYLGDDRYQAAYDSVQPYLQQGDDRIDRLMTRITVPVTIVTDPAGVAVSYPPAGAGTDWIPLGITPIREIPLPRGTTNSDWATAY